jgi:D-alanyl-D-alanine dipeptidase
MPFRSRQMLLISVLLLTNCQLPAYESSAPPGFVDITDIVPEIQLDMRYYTSNNFIGSPVVGYFAARCFLTQEAAAALAVAQQQATALNFSLKIYDCYRPQSSVNDFVSWASDPDDILQQHRFYPDVAKSELFAQGYIAAQSGHSRGSTIDLTLVPIGSKQPAVDPFANRYDCRPAMPPRYPDNSLDMGTGYDCFDPLSATDNPLINETARNNRNQLKLIMESAGFVNYDQEWWHYTFQNEPFQNEYFDFPISP